MMGSSSMTAKAPPMVARRSSDRNCQDRSTDSARRSPSSALRTPVSSSERSTEPRCTSSSAAAIWARSATSFAISTVSRSAKYSSCETSVTTGRPFRLKWVRWPVSSHSPTSSRTSDGKSRISRLFSMAGIEEALQVGAELGAQTRVPQRVVDGGLQVPQLLAGVVALALEDVAVKVARAHQLAQSVRELNLAAGPALGLLQQRENVGGEDVAADDGVVRRRIDLRLLDHVAHAEAPVAGHLPGHDAIAARLRGGHSHQGDDRPPRVFEDAAHLQETGGIGGGELGGAPDPKRVLAPPLPPPPADPLTAPP